MKTMEPKRIRVVPSPVCPVHGYPMLIGRKTESVRYWYCPEPTCSCSAKTSGESLWRKPDQELNPPAE